MFAFHKDEQNEWALDINELERSLNESKAHCRPRVLCVINPGNPTGSILTKENIAEIVKFARRNNLMVIADEVYQHNIYAEGAQFHSFKKVMSELGIQLELASCMSLSKGMYRVRLLCKEEFNYISFNQPYSTHLM